MDDENHPEVDIFVEDKESQILVEEIIAFAALHLLPRVRIIPYGAASVGKALGIMSDENRFPRSTIVIIDGDQSESKGCLILPGEDAPERVIYNNLIALNFPDVADNLSRSHSILVDECQTVVTTPDHHNWNQAIANRIICGSRELWRALCRSWVKHHYRPDKNDTIVSTIQQAIEKHK